MRMMLTYSGLSGDVFHCFDGGGQLSVVTGPPWRSPFYVIQRCADGSVVARWCSVPDWGVAVRASTQRMMVWHGRHGGRANAPGDT